MSEVEFEMTRLADELVLLSEDKAKAEEGWEAMDFERAGVDARVAIVLGELQDTGGPGRSRTPTASGTR